MVGLNSFFKPGAKSLMPTIYFPPKKRESFRPLQAGNSRI